MTKKEKFKNWLKDNKKEIIKVIFFGLGAGAVYYVVYEKGYSKGISDSLHGLKIETFVREHDDTGVRQLAMTLNNKKEEAMYVLSPENSVNWIRKVSKDLLEDLGD